jgi:putative FmdB family regulatory protein
MPTYDYECKECGHTFEEFQSIVKAKLKKCPVCGKNKLERLIGSGGGIIFKGGGFYITEHRSRQYIADKQYDNRQAKKAETLSKRKPKPENVTNS